MAACKVFRLPAPLALQVEAARALLPLDGQGPHRTRHVLTIDVQGG
jgi:hypothetical protein